MIVGVSNHEDEGGSPMNRSPLLAVMAALCGVSFAAGQPKDSRPVPTYDARTFFETVSYAGASFSADEKRLLITSDASGVFNAYSIPVEGGKPQQLTDSKTSAIFGVGYFPH